MRFGSERVTGLGHFSSTSFAITSIFYILCYTYHFLVYSDLLLATSLPLDYLKVLLHWQVRKSQTCSENSLITICTRSSNSCLVFFFCFLIVSTMPELGPRFHSNSLSTFKTIKFCFSFTIKNPSRFNRLEVASTCMWYKAIPRPRQHFLRPLFRNVLYTARDASQYPMSFKFENR